MRESCACGAFIQTVRYGRVKAWRKEHRHDVEVEATPEPDKQGAISIVEQSSEPDGHGDTKRFSPISNARIGFTLNPEA